MASTTTILIFLTILNLTHPMSNSVTRKWAKNSHINPALMDDQVEELPVPKPQLGALISAIAPTIGGFFSKLVKPVLSSLTD